VIGAVVIGAVVIGVVVGAAVVEGAVVAAVVVEFATFVLVVPVSSGDSEVAGSVTATAVGGVAAPSSLPQAATVASISTPTTIEARVLLAHVLLAHVTRAAVHA